MTNPAFDLIGLTQLRNDSRFAGINGSNMTVAVIDSGLDSTHSLLDNNYLTGRDFVNGDDVPEDVLRHGTHVAGIVGSENPDIGVAPDVKLIGLKVFRNNNLVFDTDTQAALQWVIANRERYNIVAVNMSLGGGFYTSASQAAGDIRIDEVRRLEELGVVVVSAAGNSFQGHEYQNVAAPAIFSTLSVGAVWQDGANPSYQWNTGAVDNTTGADRIISFSQRLVAPNTIFAPGAFINSTVPGNRLEELSGTSAASPMVAGAVALMQEAAMQFRGQLLSPSEVVEIMHSTADNIYDGDDENDNVQNTNTSYHRLNIYQAVQEIQRRFSNQVWELNGTGDFNQDGNIDILWHNNSTNQNGAWLMNSGGANIGWQGMSSNPAGWEINGTGDFNRDGNQDILWHNNSTNQNGAWLLNSGGANIGWQGMAGNPGEWEINGTGDFNRDGNQDILWHNNSTNQNGAWLLNSGGANIGWQGMAGNPGEWEINGTGDFNRDGNLDILWHNNSTNQNGAWLLNSGGANIGWQGMAGNPGEWEINGTGDFNRDGNLDILWHNNSTNQNGAWLLNSGGANIGWQIMSPNP